MVIQVVIKCMFVAAVACGVTSCGRSSDYWLRRFSTTEMDSHTVTSFRLTAKKGTITYEVKSARELDSLYKTLCVPNLKSFLETNARGAEYLFDYKCVFNDGQTLQYSGWMKPFKDRTYLGIYIPESGGFMEGLSKVIRLEGVLSDSELTRLRSMFLGSDEAPEYVAPPSSEHDEST